MKLYASNYSEITGYDGICQDAKHKSMNHAECATIYCETQSQLDEAIACLENDEDCEGSTDAGDLISFKDIWGTIHSNRGEGKYRINVMLGE